MLDRKDNLPFGQYARGFFTRTDEKSFRARQRRFGRDWQENTYNTYQRHLDNHAIPRFGSVLLEDLQDMDNDIEDWYLSLSSRYGKPMADSSKLKVLDALDTALSFALREHAISHNPCDLVGRLRCAPSGRRQADTFSKEEMAGLFPSDINRIPFIWGSFNNALYFSILADTGFRPGEALAINESSFTPNGGVFVTQAVDGVSLSVKDRIKTSGKGQGFKVGVLSPYTLRLKALCSPSKDGFFFSNPDGSFERARHWNSVLEDALSSLGIPRLGRTQYCLRHTFYTDTMSRIGENGLKETDVRIMMGHSGYRPEYDHRTPEQMVERLRRVL